MSIYVTTKLAKDVPVERLLGTISIKEQVAKIASEITCFDNWLEFTKHFLWETGAICIVCGKPACCVEFDEKGKKFFTCNEC